MLRTPDRRSESREIPSRLPPAALGGRWARRPFLGAIARVVAVTVAALSGAVPVFTVSATRARAGHDCQGCAGICLTCASGYSCCTFCAVSPDGSKSCGQCCTCGQTFARMPFVRSCTACDCLCQSLACN